MQTRRTLSGISKNEHAAVAATGHTAYHLRKVFQKLAITSRNQLARIPPSRLGTAECGAD